MAAGAPSRHLDDAKIDQRRRPDTRVEIAARPVPQEPMVSSTCRHLLSNVKLNLPPSICCSIWACQKYDVFVNEHVLLSHFCLAELWLCRP